ncbi:TPA: TnsA endonuclease N-terminal domain-containing protein [Photobacterium damselae]
MSSLLTPSTISALEHAFDTPARNLTKSRGKNIHRFASAKMGKRITVESTLECDACYHFDFEPSIVRFCAQPIRFPYFIDGKRHTYVPDFLVQFDTHEFVLYEVKSDYAKSKPNFDFEWAAKVQAASELGLKLELIGESDIRDKIILKNLKLIHRYASRDHLNNEQNSLLSILKLNGAQSARCLGEQLGLKGRTILPILCNLLSRCLVQTSLDKSLSLESRFELTIIAKKEFSSFYRKSVSSQACSTSTESISEINYLESITYQDISAFPEEIAVEITFRLNILRLLGQRCEKIVPKSIEPHRTELQRNHERKIPSATTIYRWWLTFRESDYDPISLAPNFKSRGNRKAKVPTLVDAIMEQAVNGVISGRKVNINSAYRRVRRKIRQYNLKHGTNYKYPKYESVRQRVKKKTPFELLAGQKGERVAKREFRRMGKKIITSSVLERVEIDHTVIDLFAVHKEHRIPLGRPWLTQLVDCYSKAVIGFYLGFEPPSYVSVSLALKNAIQRKDSLVSSYESIENEWLCYGIPDLLVTDNGNEFLSKAFDKACESLLLNVQQNKVETPDNKPHVERNYSTINTHLLDDLPGKAFSQYLQRQGYDSVGEATLTLDEIKEIYLIWLVDIYHTKPNKRGTNCPNIAWKRGIQEWEPEEFSGTKDELDFKFAIIDHKQLTKSGITVYNGLVYSSERLAEYRGRKGNHKVQFKYNPECMATIWVLDQDEYEYFTVPAIDYKYASGVSLWQHKYNIKHQAELNSVDYDEDKEIDAEIKIEKIADQSIVQTKKITARRRGARHQENSARAKSISETKPAPDKTNEENTVIDDRDWDIDYI